MQKYGLPNYVIDIFVHLNKVVTHKKQYSLKSIYFSDNVPLCSPIVCFTILFRGRIACDKHDSK